MSKSLLTTIESEFNWSVASFGCMSVFGLVFNAVITQVYGLSGLGVFNLILGLHLVFSQFIVFGLQYFLLNLGARKKESAHSDYCTVFSIVFLHALIISSLLFVSREYLISFFNSQNLETAFGYSLIGLVCFSLVKIQNFYLNSIVKIKEVNIINVLRFPIYFLVFYILNQYEYEMAKKLGLLFSFSEAILLLVSFRFIRPFGSIKLNRIKTYYSYGLKSFLNGALIEVNSRVDILMLGYFLGDKDVGLYSVAAILIEGFSHVIALLRNSLMPRIWSHYEKGELGLFIKKWGTITFKKIFILFVLTTFGYPVYLFLFYEWNGYQVSYYVFIIITFSLMITSKYFVFNLTLNQLGYPFQQTVFMLCGVLLNIILNIIFIKIFGIIGAAIATGISFILSAWILKRFLLRFIE